MRIFPVITILIAVVAFSGCASFQDVTRSPVPTINYFKPKLPGSAEIRRRIMIGKWFGEALTKDGGQRKWLTERHSDGTYMITFRKYGKNGSYEETREIGLWGIAGDIYFSIMKGWVKNNQIVPSDPENPYYYDAYKIIRLDMDYFEYKGVDDDERYILRKVKKDFQFPDY